MAKAGIKHQLINILLVTMNEGPRLSDVYKAEDLPHLSFSSNND